MKTYRITNYINGLCSYLDEQRVKYHMVDTEKKIIDIFLPDDDAFFRIAYGFARANSSYAMSELSKDK